MAPKKVVIIGGGFAGLNAAKRLGKTQYEVLLIDKTNHHLFQPLLYQVASAGLSPADIAIPIREILKHYRNISVVMGEITAIDKKNRKITFRNGDEIGYDYLIVATGASHSYFGHDEWAAAAPGMKTLSNALNLREQILFSFEKAERAHNDEEVGHYLNFVIIGGGPTGVELAGAIAEVAYHTLLRNFRNIDTAKTHIYLIEALDRVLPVFPKRLSEKAKTYLEKFGVIVLTKEKVISITEKGVETDKRFINTSNIIWAAGNKASSLLQTLDTPLDRQGRAQVNPDLSLPEHEEIFVIGDAASAKGADGLPLPGLAPVAIQQGHYVATILRKGLKNQMRPPFRYRDKGMMAIIGKNKAVVAMKKIQFTGFFAWLAWVFVHILYLITFRNRVSVLMHWVFAYFTGVRGARLISRCMETELSPNTKRKKSS